MNGAQHKSTRPASPATAAEAVATSRSGLDGLELVQLIDGSAQRFRALAGARILLTGATGWFGTWLLDTLCAADDRLQLGMRITAVSRSPDRFRARFPAFATDSRITWLGADVRRLGAALQGHTHVIHAATDSSTKTVPVPGLELFETIVDGTRSALQLAGPTCKGFLFLSSGAIYGPARPGETGFSEDQPSGPDPASPGSTYAEAKRAAEQLCVIAAAAGAPAKIARCFAFVGPHMPFDRHFAIGNFIADAQDGRVIRVNSDGRPLRSYLYMTDLVSALVAILVDGVAGRPYNVGSDAAVSIECLAQCANRVIGGRGVEIRGAVSSPSDRYVPNIARLRGELGFCPQVPLEAAIAATAKWRSGQQGGLVP